MENKKDVTPALVSGSDWRQEHAQETAHVLDLIAARLSAVAEEGPGYPSLAHSQHSPVALSSGLPAFSLFFAYRYLASKDQQDKTRAVDLLNSAIELLPECVSTPSLYQGFPGVAWTVAHLEHLGIVSNEEDQLEDIDLLLTEYLESFTGGIHFDLISGLVGLGIYALERMPRGTASRCLEMIIHRLSETATWSKQGVSWFSSPRFIGPQGRELHPNGRYDLGVAHGIPGVIGFLARCRQLGVGGSEPEELLSASVEWLLNHKLPVHSPSAFPASVSEGEPVPFSRLSWCYGDLGIAAVLLLAARCVSEARWEEEALSLARTLSRRPLPVDGYPDACLCHGSSSVGHIFNRLYRATGEEAFLRASNRWMDRTLRIRKPGQGMAGYVANYDNFARPDDPGLLMGGTGIGLALLGSSGDVDPAWDRLFMIHIPGNANQ